MIDARLLKDLEGKGFFLDMPPYENDERIIHILKSGNERLYAAIPLLLLEGFDYDKIIRKSGKKKEFDRILSIAAKIYSKEGIKSSIIARKINIPSSEFDYYYNNFRDSTKRRQESYDIGTSRLSGMRNKIGLSKSLAEIFSPAKIRIMRQIFEHGKLSNTELKYYYKAIRPLINAILDEDLKQYLKVVGNAKKEHY